MNMGLLGLLGQIPQGGGLLNLANRYPGYVLPWLRGLPQQTPPVVSGQGNFWQGNQFMMGNVPAPSPQPTPIFTPPPAVEGTAAYVTPAPQQGAQEALPLDVNIVRKLRNRKGSYGRTAYKRRRGLY